MAKVLIVEDEQLLQSIYYHLLNDQGHEVNVASDGFEALQVLEVFAPDVILLDILMPKMDGLEFLKLANLSQVCPHAAIIAFSNFSDSSKIAQAMQLGATKSVLKSDMSPRDIVDMVSDYAKPK